MAKRKTKDKGKLAVVVCFSDFAKNAKLKENFKKFYSELKESGYPIYVGEILSDKVHEIVAGQQVAHDKPQLNEIVNGDNYFALDISAPFGCRENMINVMVDYFVPPEYTKIVWVDGNILPENKNWLSDMEKMLDKHDLVQIGNEFLSLDEKGEVALQQPSGAKGHLDGKSSEEIRNDYHLGGGWGVKRSFFKEFGIFDLDFSDSGDSLTFLSAINNLSESDVGLLDLYKEHNLELYYHLSSYNASLVEKKLKVGFIDQPVKLLYSGDHCVKEYKQVFDPSSLESLKSFEYPAVFALSKDRFNAEATEHKPFYKTGPQGHLVSQYFKKYIDHLYYKDSRDKITAVVESVQGENNNQANPVPAQPNAEIQRFELPVPAMEHLIKTWQSARDETEKRKQEFERAAKREEMVFEAFKKGMIDTMTK